MHVKQRKSILKLCIYSKFSERFDPGYKISVDTVETFGEACTTLSGNVLIDKYIHVPKTKKRKKQYGLNEELHLVDH